MMENLGLPAVLVLIARTHFGLPERFQVLHVETVDLGKRGITLIEGVAAVGEPVFHWQRSELLTGEDGGRDYAGTWV